MTGIGSVFNRLEARLQSLFEGILTRLFPPSGWQTELALRLSEALRDGAQSHMGILFAPDQYTIYLPAEQAILLLESPMLLDVLADQLGRAAMEAGYRFRARPSLRAIPSPERNSRLIQVTAQFSQEHSGQTDYLITEPLPQISVGAFLIIDGVRLYPLSETVTNIGRLSDNHLVIEDGRVSRRHAQIRYINDRFVIFDLGSSGGTYVNNQRVTQAVLKPGDVISLAGVPIVFGLETDDSPLAPTQELNPRLD